MSYSNSNEIGVQVKDGNRENYKLLVTKDWKVIKLNALMVKINQHNVFYIFSALEILKTIDYFSLFFFTETTEKKTFKIFSLQRFNPRALGCLTATKALTMPCNSLPKPEPSKKKTILAIIHEPPLVCCSKAPNLLSLNYSC